ncbi:hypothetical protein GCM10007973_25720 [Polymorphobacter multimanifer]|uniref:Uncharacterized protein n=1 Tax=Polymorphobacter multimanifer TaxID=1070431 RepID=A0A841LA23_9SPHN|nr:hypothetical protein [Polymorphobacter multimanifer]MBB6229384.1 hypothetical protein [Polymorphobacter multimanifer]GGI88218.1 hypothetical protein GCM10007973_25720 [Polymorphobacter multimanifer]
MNTLDLDPDLAIDLVEDVEREFDFTFTREEAERCWTVGDIYAVIVNHEPAEEVQIGKCGSAMTFYKIRGALDPDRTKGLTPGTALVTHGKPNKLFKMLKQETGFRLPDTKLTSLGMAGGYLLSVGFLIGIVALLNGYWEASGIAFVVGVLGVALGWTDPGRLPIGVATVGDLVRRTAALNARLLQIEGGRSCGVWSILTALAAEHGSLQPDQITKATFLHRKSMKLASAA